MQPKRTCMLVDDDTDDHEIFLMALENLNESMDCISALNAPEALTQLNVAVGVMPDYIFLDLNMPRMNGKQCLAAIKSQPHLDHVPVVIYSTSSSPMEIKEFMKMGAVAFIKKPSSIPELTKTLQHFFSGSYVDCDHPAAMQSS
jgi:CheY-like chemotaxis protein